VLRDVAFVVSGRGHSVVIYTFLPAAPVNRMIAVVRSRVSMSLSPSPWPSCAAPEDYVEWLKLVLLQAVP